MKPKTQKTKPNTHEIYDFKPFAPPGFELTNEWIDPMEYDGYFLSIFGEAIKSEGWPLTFTTSNLRLKLKKIERVQIYNEEADFKELIGK